MAVSKVSKKGAVVIPATIRKKYGITPTSKVEFIDQEEYIQLMPIPDDSIEIGKGMFHSSRSVSEMIKLDRFSENKRDAQLLEIGHL